MYLLISVHIRLIRVCTVTVRGRVLYVIVGIL